MSRTAGRWAALSVALALAAAAAWWSYRSAGFVFALLHTTSGEPQSLEVLRDYLATWGAFGPVAYLLLVIVEVLVAPIPGTLLYAPGGALFGGFVGGSLSLAGNAIGAGLAGLIARYWGEPITRGFESQKLARLRQALAERGLWVILLLRVNPLTSSDLVSYAAGLVGVPVWKVFAGTFVGMAPLCYAQAYLADRLFRVMPGSLWMVIALGVAYAAVVLWLLVGPRAAKSR